MKINKLSFDFGEIPLRGVYKDSLIIEEGIEDFQYMSGSCYCTQVKLVGNTIELEFTPSKAIVDIKPGEKKNKPAFVYIYTGKEVPEFISDENGVRISNSEKKRIVVPINYLAVG